MSSISETEIKQFIVSNLEDIEKRLSELFDHEEDAYNYEIIEVSEDERDFQVFLGEGGLSTEDKDDLAEVYIKATIRRGWIDRTPPGSQEVDEYEAMVRIDVKYDSHLIYEMDDDPVQIVDDDE